MIVSRVVPFAFSPARSGTHVETTREIPYPSPLKPCGMLVIPAKFEQSWRSLFFFPPTQSSDRLCKRKIVLCNQIKRVLSPFALSLNLGVSCDKLD